jgi:transposase
LDIGIHLTYALRVLKNSGPVHLTTIRRSYKGKEYVSHLLRRSYREGGKVKSQTVGNLSALPPAAIEAVRAILSGVSVGRLDQSFEIQRSLPHGHVLAVLGHLRQLALDKLLAARPGRQRELAVAMIVSRVLHPDSKLATARSLSNSSLAGMLGVEGADEDELYSAMDWLLERQPAVEAALARRHLAEGGLVLYDLTSVYLEGRQCELARRGYNRDGKRGLPQIEFGLITNAEGCPVGIDVFEGNLADPVTVAGQVDKIKEGFGIAQVVLVGDRGMLTSARIEVLKEAGGVSWISALRAAQIASLVNDGDLQLGLFDKRNLAEISSPRFPGERLVVCKNPALAEERARKREELLEATEQDLAKVAESVTAGRLKTAAKIGERVGRILNKYKVGKHFQREIAEGRFSYRRDQAKIEAEAGLDGLYVIRSNVAPETLSDQDLVRSYKSLSRVERAFRTMKSVDLQVRPVHHRLADRVRAHIFLCMLAYYVRWHLERKWASLLFRDEQPPLVEDPVAPAQRSATALAKTRHRRRLDGTLAFSFRSLLAELATLTKNTIRLAGSEVTFEKLALPTPLQAEALRLLGLSASL